MSVSSNRVVDEHLKKYEPFVAWLEERITADEKLLAETGPAKVAWGTYRNDDGSMRYTTPVAETADGIGWVVAGECTEPDETIVVYDPVRWQEECLVKRKAIAEYRETLRCCADDPADTSARIGAITVLGMLRWFGEVYEREPGYREEWRAADCLPAE